MAEEFDVVLDTADLIKDGKGPRKGVLTDGVEELNVGRGEVEFGLFGGDGLEVGRGLDVGCELVGEGSVGWDHHGVEEGGQEVVVGLGDVIFVQE